MLASRVTAAIRRRTLGRLAAYFNELRRRRAEAEVHRRQAWWEENWGSTETKTVDLPRGVRLRLYADSVLCRLIDTSSFEESELDFVRSYLRQGDVFFDVGANIGLFTVVASDAVGKSGEVHAFEPCGKTFSRLGENVDLNGVVNVRLNQLALSAEPGRLELNVSVDGHDAWNSFAGTLAGGEGTREVVEVCTLDGYCMSRKLWPNLVKVDVEGWEASVLRGGQSVLQSHRSPDLLVEFTRSNCIAAGTSTNELFKQITSFGYELFHVDSVAEPRPAAADEDFPYCNLLATKDLPAVRRRLVR